MPIKDQCKNCRYQLDDNCTQLAPSFDGTSCDVYVKRINLAKEKEEEEQTPPSHHMPYESSSETSAPEYDCEEDETPSDEDIHGWLKFFLIVFVGIGSIATLVMSFVTFESDANIWLSFGDVVYAVIYLLTGIFTIIAFHKRDSDAVFLAKTFVIFCFASNLLSLFLNDAGDLGGEKAVISMIRSIVWCCIWFIFLFNSNQVERLIPKSYRKTKTRDWILIGAIVLLPFFLIGLGIAAEKKTHNDIETAAVANLSLSSNQYTDGRIVLTIPYGTDCDETNTDKIKVFTVSDPETGAESTIVSDYDDDVTKKNFNQYWRSWKPEDLNNIDYEVISDDKQSNDDVTVFYKLVRVNLENPVDWEFALVFDHKSGKVCLVSTYSSAEGDSPTSYFINNLRFL